MIIDKRKYIEPDKADRDWGIYILGAGRQTSKFNASTDGRVLNDFAFVYVEAGKGKYFSEDGKSLKVGTGTLIVLLPGVWHRYTPNENRTWDEYWIIFNGAYMEMLRDKGFLKENRPVLNPGYDTALIKAFEYILELCCTKPHESQKEMSAGLLKIIARAEYLEKHKETHEQNEFIDDVKRRIEKFKGTSPAWPELAKKFNMSYVHFRRTFKKQTGQSLHKYYLQLQINKAKESLASHKYSVKEICEKLGFKDQYYFSRIFRKKTGSPPSTWQSL